MKRALFAILVILITLSFSCQKANTLSKTEDLSHLMTTQDKRANIEDNNFIDVETAVSMAESNDFTAMIGPKSAYKDFTKLAVRTKETDSLIIIRDSNYIADFYIIQFKNHGFKIVSADKRIPVLLAFSDNNSFNEQSVTEGLNDWLVNKKKLVEAVRYDSSFSERLITSLSKSTLSAGSSEHTRTVTDSFGPILETKWDQGSGYNTYCPILNCSTAGNGRAWTGCVATSMAQVMYYYKYPKTYDFSAMPLYVGSGETARLMHDIGVAVDMDYKECNGSGTSGDDKTIPGFHSFGYTGGSKMDGTDFATIANEIKNKRPVVISGGRKGHILIFNTYKDGHEWVCDGCMKVHTTSVVCRPVPRGGCSDYTVQGTMYLLHMNWGWSGYNDGYYSIGSFNPGSVNNQEGQEGTYNYKTETYYGMLPDNI